MQNPCQWQRAKPLLLPLQLDHRCPIHKRLYRLKCLERGRSFESRGWFGDFDNELAEENLHRLKEGEAGFLKSEVKIMGQLGLLLGVSDVGLNSTADLGATIQGDQMVKSMFKRFLLRHHLVLDDDGELFKMPKDTHWNSFYEGKFIVVYVADPLSIVKSKAQFQRLKDKGQLKKIFDRHPEWKQQTINAGISLEWLDA